MGCAFGLAVGWGTDWPPPAPSGRTKLRICAGDRPDPATGLLGGDVARLDACTRLKVLDCDAREREKERRRESKREQSAEKEEDENEYEAKSTQP